MSIYEQINNGGVTKLVFKLVTLPLHLQILDYWEEYGAKTRGK